MRTDFKIDNPKLWMRQHRGEYLAALLTLARGWVNAGRPQKRVRSDEFKDWVEGLRGLMAWAGFAGTFGGSEANTVVSSDDEEWAIFLDALHEWFGEYPILVRDIVDALRMRGRWNSLTHTWETSMRGVDPALLPDVLAHKWDAIAKTEASDSGFRKSLGHWCRNHAGRWAGDLKLDPAGTNATLKQPMYKVVAKPVHDSTVSTEGTK